MADIAPPTTAAQADAMEAALLEYRRKEAEALDKAAKQLRAPLQTFVDSAAFKAVEAKVEEMKRQYMDHEKVTTHLISIGGSMSALRKSVGTVKPLPEGD